MYWNQIRQTSLKLRLLALLLPIMALVTASTFWLTRADAMASANLAYDRSLLGAIKALDLNVSTASGGVSVELPYRLFEFFQLTATGSVYFRVATVDGRVEIGNPDLPRPPASLKVGQPMFYDAIYFGETVRVGAFMRPLAHPVAGSGNPELVIQVAESTASREKFTSSFLRRSVGREASVLLVMCIVIVLGLPVVLRPMTRLAAQTRAREPDDLRPLITTDLPSDICPLVDAVNQQIARVEELVAERRRFVEDASHQLRTPLAILRAQLDYLLREPDLAQRELALQALSDELGHAIRATNQLLTLAHSDAEQPQRGLFDLGDLVRNVALELLPLARARSVDFGVEVIPEILPCEGDRGLLHHALINIAHNAIQHGRSHGVVTIQATTDDLGYILQVSDNGDGIEPAVAQRLGQRFVKSRSSRGSGLGLSIARSIIERHGGTLRIEPVPEGSGLWVTLWWPKT